ncbi:hypothetical protein [Olleya sp. 1-3]|uniref:hypothetical protein n=1 Tax=Olleya sp. 1-3 TaxID=2058323 RepID=UPI0012FEC9A0|nr:hypothetical protein [Olleya sp. 1-3]
MIVTVTVIFAVRYWDSYKNSKQRYFLHFLCYVLFSEVFAAILGPVLKINNYFVFNIYTVASFLFYLFWFNTIIENKKVINSFLIVFVASVVFSLFRESFVDQLWSIPLTTGTVIIIITSAIFFKNFLNKKEVVNFKSSQPFWIIAGLLIFYIGFLPIQLLMFYLETYSDSYTVIISLLNVILYGSIIKSFLCLKTN